MKNAPDLQRVRGAFSSVRASFVDESRGLLYAQVNMRERWASRAP